MCFVCLFGLFCVCFVCILCVFYVCVSCVSFMCFPQKLTKKSSNMLETHLWLGVSIFDTQCCHIMLFLAFALFCTVNGHYKFQSQFQNFCVCFVCVLCVFCVCFVFCLCVFCVCFVFCLCVCVVRASCVFYVRFVCVL